MKPWLLLEPLSRALYTTRSVVGLTTAQWHCPHRRNEHPKTRGLFCQVNTFCFGRVMTPRVHSLSKFRSTFSSKVHHPQHNPSA